MKFCLSWEEEKVVVFLFFSPQEKLLSHSKMHSQGFIIFLNVYHPFRSPYTKSGDA